MTCDAEMAIVRNIGHIPRPMLRVGDQRNAAVAGNTPWLTWLPFQIFASELSARLQLVIVLTVNLITNYGCTVKQAPLSSILD